MKSLLHFERVDGISPLKHLIFLGGDPWQTVLRPGGLACCIYLVSRVDGSGTVLSLSLSLLCSVLSRIQFRSRVPGSSTRACAVGCLGAFGSGFGWVVFVYVSGFRI